MPHISEKGHLMPKSPIRKLVPYAEEAKRQGRIVYHLNIGQPDIPTAPTMLAAVKAADMSVVEYSHSAGNESLRRKLAAAYQKQGLDVDFSEIMVTTGGSEALVFAMMTCMNPGDEIIIPEPFYANYNSFAVQAGVNVKPVSSDINNGFALPPIEAFEKVITNRTRAILISNPNNPTGYLYSKAELEKLSHIVKKYDMYLFADEVYSEFCYDGQEFYSVLKLKNIRNNTILIDSVSKKYSACGFRIGALVTHNKQVIETAMKFAMARLSPPSFGQIAAEAALDTPKEYFENAYNEYLARRNYLVKAMNSIDGVHCLMPKGAFYTMASLPVKDADDFAMWLLRDFQYENQTVMLAPASGFYASLGSGHDQVRIAYVLSVDKLQKAIKCIEEALKVYPGRILK
jgi:aspartate aminotransferase